VFSRLPESGGAGNRQKRQRGKEAGAKPKPAKNKNPPQGREAKQIKGKARKKIKSQKTKRKGGLYGAAPLLSSSDEGRFTPAQH